MALVSTASRIGPNAITRVAQALLEQLGSERTAELFARADLSPYLVEPPQSMVDETEVARLHQVLHAQLEPALVADINRQAGLKTAHYLLAKRIPKPVQMLLKVLPAAPAARLLLKAIGSHSWTFVGSGQFHYELGQSVLLSIHNNPLCRGLHSQTPACDFYGTTFEHLFQVLVQSKTTCQEIGCEAQGDDACRFVLRWR